MEIIVKLDHKENVSEITNIIYHYIKNKDKYTKRTEALKIELDPRDIIDIEYDIRYIEIKKYNLVTNCSYIDRIIVLQKNDIDAYYKYRNKVGNYSDYLVVSLNESKNKINEVIFGIF